MSDRLLSGPPRPPRPVGQSQQAPAPASSLIRANRNVGGPPQLPRPVPAEPVQVPDASVGSDAETTASETYPAVEPVVEAKAAQVPGESEAEVPATVESVVEAPTPATSSTAVVASEQTPASTANVGEVSAPAPVVKKPRNADPKSDDPDDILKVTFDIRRGDRDAFNAAVPAAMLFEGHKNAGAFIAFIYNRERERLERDYNQGRPFERREKPLPRGGSFKKQS